MQFKTKILIAGALLILSFAAGRYSNSYTQSTEVSQSETDKESTKNTQTHTESTTTKEPDGTVKTVVITDTNKNVETKKTESEQVQKSVTTITANKVTVSALAGVNTNTFLPNYGASVSKNLAGPITIGLWGLNNGILGISVGVEF